MTQTTIAKWFISVFLITVYLIGVFGFIPGENPNANILVRVLWPYIAILEVTGAL